MELEDIGTNEEVASSVEDIEMVEMCNVDRATTTPVSSLKSDNGKSDPVDRYENINLGIVQTILFTCFQSAVFALKTTIIIVSIFSVIDIISDHLVLTELIYRGLILWPILVFFADYVPGWLMLCHNLTSKKWSAMKSRKQKVIMIILLLFSPFSMALSHLSWLGYFDSADEDLFEFLHHSCRLSQIFNGSFESPLQLLFLIILWGKRIFPLPWEDELELEDSHGNRITIQRHILS